MFSAFVELTLLRKTDGKQLIVKCNRRERGKVLRCMVKHTRQTKPRLCNQEQKDLNENTCSK